jgi:hypothetical protein
MKPNFTGESKMKSPSILRTFARRTFLQTVSFSVVLFMIAAYFYWYSQPPGTPSDPMAYASLFAFLFLYGVLAWLFQKNTLAGLLTHQSKSPAKKKSTPAPPQKSEADNAKREIHEKRLFVHLFGVLQREGRLLDFLQEDLSLYEDGQIGAAVRSIHENCKKTMDRYLSPVPIMEQAEGDSVEIAAGFDQHAVKLVGNVVGQPPFTGIVRHRGWRLHTSALPELSETGDPGILAPAEVEIQ